MIYITGDTHRDFSRLYKLNKSEDDMLKVKNDIVAEFDNNAANQVMIDINSEKKEYKSKTKLLIYIFTVLL